MITLQVYILQNHFNADMYRYLDRYNCYQHTRFHIKQLLALTGIFGLHPRFTSSQSVRCVLIQTYQRVEIEINETKYLEVLTVEIDLENKTLTLKLVKKRGNREDIALDLLASQVRYANKFGFQYIFLLAYGASEKSEYIGYKFWSKFGFLMTEKIQKKFNSKLLKYIANNSIVNNEIYTIDTTLYDLQSTKQGKAIWESIAFDWLGIFFVDNESNSLKLLNKILAEKNKQPIQLQ